VVGWTERGELPAVSYASATAEDDEMVLGEIRAIDGPPSAMLAQVSDMTVLQAETSILAALHDSRGARLGTLVVLLKSMPEENRACVQVLRMIAGRVSAELERMESENRFQRLQTLLMSSAERIGLWERDLRNDRVTWSSEIYRILGHEPDTIPATRERFLSMVHPEDRPRLLDACDDAASRCARTSVRYRVIRPDGSERRIAACYEPSLDITGRLCGMLGTIRDVTEE
jgi:PAS domain S-box-containing protein